MKATDYGSDDHDAAKRTLIGPTPGLGRVEASPSKTKRVAACAVVALAIVGAGGALHTVMTGHGVVTVEAPQPQALTLASAQTTVWPTDNPVLTSGQMFLIVCGMDGRCVHDGDAQRAGQVIFRLWNCDPEDKNMIFPELREQLPGMGPWTCVINNNNNNNKNMIFVYDPKTNALRNPYKNLCWDDDGQWNSGLRLRECSGNMKTKFTYNWTERAIRTPSQPGLCIDAADFHLRVCDPTKPSQQFEIVPKDW